MQVKVIRNIKWKGEYCDFTSTSKRGLAIHISAMHK